jgi:hypothetical protein
MYMRRRWTGDESVLIGLDILLPAVDHDVFDDNTDFGQ